MMLNRLNLSIKKNKYTIGVFILFFVCTIIFRLSLKEFTFSSIFFSFINSSIYFFLLSLFAKTRLRLFVIAIVSFFFAVDVGLFSVYGNPMNYGIMASIFETNLTEAYSMSKLALPVGLLGFIICFFLLCKSSQEMKEYKKVSFFMSIPFILLSLFAIPLAADMRSSKESLPMILNVSQMSPPMFNAQLISVKYPFVTSTPFFVIAYWDAMVRFRKEARKTKVLPSGVVFDKEKSIPDKIILIIGESSNQNHYSLYGYQKATTPFLDSLALNSDLLSYFQNVISPAAFTHDALRISLSFATQLDGRPFFSEKNIINLANDAGYETYWISNQEKFGFQNSYVGMIAASADTAIYSSDLVKDDLRLPPILQSILKPDSKQFIVLHLNGSHLTYEDKYDSFDTKALGSVGETIEYDKSIHHTDRTLREVFKLIQDKDEKAVIFYYSDHGEVVNVGHAILNKYKVQFQIPLIVIQNKPVNKLDEIINKYYNQESGLLSSSSLINILGEFIGYQIPDSILQETKRSGVYIYQCDGTWPLYKNIKD